MNHSAQPTCAIEVDVARHCVNVRATRAVPPGGELTLRYCTNASSRLAHEIEMLTRYSICA
jgi:hypothetical protein